MLNALGHLRTAWCHVQPGVTTMPSPLSSPNVLQPNLYLSPAYKEWVHFTVPLQHFFRDYLGIYTLPCSFIPCSIPTVQRQGPQLRNLFPTQTAEDQNFINSSWWWTNNPKSQKMPLLGTCIICEGSWVGHWTLYDHCDLAPGFLFIFTCQHPHPPAPYSPWLSKQTPAMAVLATRDATPHLGDFAHPAASSPEPNSKGAWPWESYLTTFYFNFLVP